MIDTDRFVGRLRRLGMRVFAVQTGERAHVVVTEPVHTVHDLDTIQRAADDTAWAMRPISYDDTPDGKLALSIEV